MKAIQKDKQYFKFCFYGFLKNLRFFEAFFILFLLEKGLSYTQIGLLYALREILTNIAEIPSGIIADTYGRKKALIASFLIYITSFYIFYLSNTFWLFMSAFLLYGVADAFRSGTHKGMIMDYLKLKNWEDQKINYYGHTRACSQKGSAISSLVAGVIVFYTGKYQSIFLYAIIPYIVNLFLIISYPQKLNRSLNHFNLQAKFSLKQTLKSLLLTLKKPNVLRLINTSAMHTAYLRAVKDYIQPLLVNIALLTPVLLDVEIEKKNGIFIGILYFFIYLGTSRASQLASRVAVKNKLNISYITLLLGFVLGILSGVFYHYNLWIFALLTFVGIYLIENIRKPILTGFISDHVPNEILTSVISAQSLWKTAITAIFAFSFGVFADYFGIGVAFVILATFLTFLTILTTRRSI